MKEAKVIHTVSKPLPAEWDDFDEADCLCQGKVPDDRRIDFLQRKLGKDEKWRWKSVLRYHMDCPIHGVHPCRAD